MNKRTLRLTVGLVLSLAPTQLFAQLVLGEFREVSGLARNVSGAIQVLRRAKPSFDVARLANPLTEAELGALSKVEVGALLRVAADVPQEADELAAARATAVINRRALLAIERELQEMGVVNGRLREPVQLPTISRLEILGHELGVTLENVSESNFSFQTAPAQLRAIHRELLVMRTLYQRSRGMTAEAQRLWLQNLDLMGAMLENRRFEDAVFSGRSIAVRTAASLGQASPASVDYAEVQALFEVLLDDVSSAPIEP